MLQQQMELLPTAGTALAVVPQATSEKIPAPIVKDRSLEDAMMRIFPKSQDEARLEQARRIMGDEVKALSDAELTEHLAQFQYLIDQWLDEFERQAFEGRTLRQLIGG